MKNEVNEKTMMNVFEATYAMIQDAKAACDNATDAAGRDVAAGIYKEAMENITGLDKMEAQLWRAYETSRDCGNKYIDIADPISDSTVEELIAVMRRCGVEAFTFSSTWSSAVETAWLFQKAGCTLEGLLEINSHHKEPWKDTYEKAHGYLFKVN